jgi:RNA polymerase-binding protein DksA
MDARDIRTFRRALLQQRQMLLGEVSRVEAELQQITEHRDSEIEEAAQEERTARLLAQLDDRGKAELSEIDRALFRIEKKRYGVCEGCGERIPKGRLAALPATPYCRECAGRVERGVSLENEPEDVPRSGPIPADYSLLTGRELEEAIREHVHNDGRVDLEELRIVCRHGVVYLDGALPSQAEHQIVLHTITDVMGLTEVVDRVQIREILWEREDRDKPGEAAEKRPWDDSGATEDVTESHDQGVDFEPPEGPVPDEE